MCPLCTCSSWFANCNPLLIKRSRWIAVSSQGLRFFSLVLYLLIPVHIVDVHQLNNVLSNAGSIFRTPCLNTWVNCVSWLVSFLKGLEVVIIQGKVISETWRLSWFLQGTQATSERTSSVQWNLRFITSDKLDKWSVHDLDLGNDYAARFAWQFKHIFFEKQQSSYVMARSGII